MAESQLHLDSEARAVPHLPFLSETGLQDFVEAHAAEVLGIQVIAPAQRGRMVSKIDLLGLDSSKKLWIIECKHDLVDSTAVTQVHRYGSDPTRLWSEVNKQTGLEIPLNPPDPGFVLIGYRYDRDYSDNRTICLTYEYHDVAMKTELVQNQLPGRVSVHPIGPTSLLKNPHPRVSKKLEALRRIEQLAPDLLDSFRIIDDELGARKGVEASYGGKNYIRYSAKQGRFAEAEVLEGAIHWHLTFHKTEHQTSESEVARVKSAIVSAYETAR